MTNVTTDSLTTVPSAISLSTGEYREVAQKHLWRHFSDMSPEGKPPLKVISGGEGCFLFDTDGNRYLDGVSQLVCVEVGYSFGEEFAQAAAEQYRKIGFAMNFGRANPRSIELAEVVAELAPEGMNHVWFTPSGSEGIETAWKMARQFFAVQGKRKWKAISRQTAYHGVTMGALSLGGVNDMRKIFEPLVPGVARVSNTLRSGRPAHETDEEFTKFLLDEMEATILREDPETISMIILEPVQNHGGSLIPPAGYLEGVRALCDTYDILLVADETVSAWGRIGAWFASTRYNMRPDIISTAKGMSSSMASIGAVIASDRVFDQFIASGVPFVHGSTFTGHPVQAAVALKNIEIMKRLDLVEHVLQHEDAMEEMVRTFEDLSLVRDVRGAGYMWSIELARTTPSGVPLSAGQLVELYGEDALGGALEARGLILRLAADDGDPILFIAPPLVAGPEEFEYIRSRLREVLESIEKVYLSYV